MTYGTEMNLTVPTIDGVATEAEAAPLINECLLALIARLETKVTPAGMDITSDLSMASGGVSYGLDDAKRVGLAAESAAISAATYPGTLYRVGSNLYYNDGSGNQVQITAGGAVNVSTTGGITGTNYGVTGKEVNWDDVNSRYRMRSGTGTNDYADVSLSDVLFSDGSSNFVRLQAPAIAADYTLSLPLALPGSTQVLTVSSAGQISPATTVTTFNTITASNTITAGNFNVGSGTYRMSSRDRYVHAFSGTSQTTVADWTLNPTAGYVGGPVVGLPWVMPVPFDASHERIVSVNALVRGSAAETLTLRLYYVDVTGTVTQVGADQTTSGSATLQTLSLTTINHVMTAGAYWLYFSPSDADANLRIYYARITYDRP